MKNRSYLLRVGAIRLPIKTLPKPVLYKEPELRKFYAVGEKFEHEGQTYLVIESNNCRDCDSCIKQTYCTEGARIDGKNVVFKRLNK